MLPTVTARAHGGGALTLAAPSDYPHPVLAAPPALMGKPDTPDVAFVPLATLPGLSPEGADIGPAYARRFAPPSTAPNLPSNSPPSLKAACADRPSSSSPPWNFPPKQARFCGTIRHTRTQTPAPVLSQQTMTVKTHAHVRHQTHRNHG